MTLSRTAAKGTAVTLIGQVAKFLIQGLSIVVLARIISPDDFGLYVMVASLAGFAVVIGDFGLSAASIQAKVISHREKSNLFWINVALGIFGGAVIFLSAPYISEFYGEPALEDIARAMCAVFVINALAVQHKAELSRSLRFTALTVLEILSQAVGLAVALTLALSGWGVWALVGQQIGTAAAVTITAWILARWRPSIPDRKTSVKKYVYYGANTMGGALTNYVSSNVDSIALGKFAGASSVGIYGRMFQLFSLPLQQLATPLTRVALPVLSTLQDDQERYVQYMQRALTSMAYVFLFGFTSIVIAAPNLVPFVLGGGWSEGVLVLQILAIGGVFQGLGYIYYWAFLSRAKTNVMFRLSLVSRTIMVFAILIAAPKGMYAVAAAVSFGLFINWTINTVWGLPQLKIARTDLLSQVWRPATLLVPFCLVCLFTQSLVGTAWSGNFVVLLSGLSAQVMFLAVSALIWPAVRNDLLGIFRLVKMATKRG